MHKARKKPVEIEFITFEEFVQFGRNQPNAHIVNGMPWSFIYKGSAITHEHDESYIVRTLEGPYSFTRNDVLITGIKGELYPCKKDIFALTYDVIE